MMIIGEFLRLAKEIHDARPPLSAPIVLLDAAAEAGTEMPLVISESDKPVPALLASILPPGAVVLRVVRSSTLKPAVVVAP
jgi:hypothetical protein